MNYQQLINNLLAEAKVGQQYKQLSKPYRTMVKIALFPILLLNFLLIAAYYVQLFFYNALTSPVTYLESWQEEKKDTVQHATQAVIYFISTPFIFFLRVLLSLASFIFFGLWFSLMVVTYVATLGGIRWQPCINTATYDGYAQFKRQESDMVVYTYVVSIFSVFVVGVLTFVVGLLGAISLVHVATVLSTVWALIAWIATPVIFKRKVEISDEAPAIEEKTTEEIAENAAEEKSSAGGNWLDYIANSCFVWAVIGIISFLYAISLSYDHLFDWYDTPLLGLTICSIIMMLASILGIALKLAGPLMLGKGELPTINAKSILVALLSLVCIALTAYGAYDCISNWKNRPSGDINQDQAITLAMNSEDVKRDITDWMGVEYNSCTIYYNTATANQESDGDWVVRMQGQISGYDRYDYDRVYEYFTITVEVSENGRINGCSLSY